MIMILTKMALSCAVVLIVSAPSNVEKSATGTWSQPVNGVRGRLIVSEGEKYNGTKMVSVYLELRNVSDIGNPIEMYFDPTESIQCELLDANDKPVARAGLPADILTPLPFWLTMPYDSSLRFRISVSGYGVSKDAGLMVQMSCGDWLIKDNDRGEYSLEITFVARPTKEDRERRAWQGTLKVPKVMIPRSPL